MNKLFITTTMCLAAIVACVPTKKRDPEKKTKPNVLFILVDDLGCHDLSYTGNKYYETPNIDKIASSAMVFTNGYAACQVCSPSRASIMTGKFSVRHGITDYIGAKSGTDWRKNKRFTKLLPAEYLQNLLAEYTTLPEAMKQAGYKTFFAGKWHLGNKGSWPEDHGFDVNIGGWDAGSPNGGYFSPWKNPNLANGKNGENLSMRLAGETVKFIKENNPNETGQPVFAFLAFYAVHSPIQTTNEKWIKYRDKAEQMGIADKAYEMGHFLPIRQVQDNPIYGGLVETMDNAVGLVLNTLDELNLADNTIVIFTSDNGGVVAGDAYSTSNAPLRGGKGYQFEGGIRVPYFIKVPGLTKPGSQFDMPVIATDFYPTLLDLIGEPLLPEEHTDGISLVPVFGGRTLPERPLIWHYPHYGNQGGEPSSIVRLGDWKLIHYYEDGHEELYNLKEDIGEQNDIVQLDKKKAEELHQMLFEYRNRLGAKYPGKDPEYNPLQEKRYLEEVKTVLLPKLERQRKNMLFKDFNPGNNWWGSQITID